MILMIDNYDSFTYNLVQYLGELGQDLKVARNDAMTVEHHAPPGSLMSLLLGCREALRHVNGRTPSLSRVLRINQDIRTTMWPQKEQPRIACKIPVRMSA